MPSTITSFYEFSPNTKAKSSEVNTNFANYRGDIVPVNDNTASASNLTHNLGTSEHRWLGVYAGTLDIEGATSTVDLRISGDTSITAGAYNIIFGSTTVAKILPDGLDGAYISKVSPINTSSAFATGILPGMQVATYIAPGSFTIGGAVSNIAVFAAGGGGGGGGGKSRDVGDGSGGQGGRGAQPFLLFIPVTPGGVLSITVGAGGGGGVGELNGAVAAAGASGGITSIVYSGTTICSFDGAQGGAAGAGTSNLDIFQVRCQNVGAGLGGDAAPGTSGQNGNPSMYASGGIGGSPGSPNGGGGSGGGAGYGVGANGAAGVNSGTPNNGFSANSGTSAGGGGGGGNGDSTVNADGGTGGVGGSGVVHIYYID